MQSGAQKVVAQLLATAGCFLLPPLIDEHLAFVHNKTGRKSSTTQIIHSRLSSDATSESESESETRKNLSRTSRINPLIIPIESTVIYWRHQNEGEYPFRANTRDSPARSEINGLEPDSSICSPFSCSSASDYWRWFSHRRRSTLTANTRTAT